MALCIVSDESRIREVTRPYEPDDLDREIAALLRAHADEMSYEMIAACAKAFPHCAAKDFAFEDPCQWALAQIEGLAHVLETGDTSQQHYAYFYADLITQASTEFMFLDNFMESKLCMAQVVLRYVWTALRLDQEKAGEALRRIESVVHRILRENLASFADDFLSPGELTKRLQVAAPAINSPVAPSNALTSINEENAPATETTNGRSDTEEELLSSRELEVLRLIAAGNTNSEIATNLGIAQFTVKNHVSRLLRKLHLGNRTELAIYAMHEDLAS